MKKILKIILISLSIILIKLLVTFTINEIIIINYNNKIYNRVMVKSLYFLNFIESYIVYYNDGNILYQNNEFEEAILKYQKALEKNPPQNKVCDIRINLSLSLIKNISSNSYNEIYAQLQEAKNNLYNNSCASSIDDSGYSKEAEKLEKEITDLQNQLKNEENQENVEEQLKEIEKKANQNRQSDLNEYENMGNYSYYSGKRW